jgi:hypothetical protein
MAKSKLEPHKSIIKRWVNKGMLDKEIASKLKDKYGLTVRPSTVKTFRLNHIRQDSKEQSSKLAKNQTNAKKPVDKRLKRFEIKKVVKELKDRVVDHLNRKEVSTEELNDISESILHIMEIESYFPDKFKDW